MKKVYFSVLLLSLGFTTFAQTQKYPIYKGCEGAIESQYEKCFLAKVVSDFYVHFKKPIQVSENEARFYVLFQATKKGIFEVIHVSSMRSEINVEVERVFANLPEFQPASIDNHPIDKQFIIYYPDTNRKDHVPIIPTDNTLENADISNQHHELSSSLRMPLSNFQYSLIENSLLDGNQHTAVKPYIYSNNIDVQKFTTTYQALSKNKSSWWGRKFWDEHMVDISGNSYWFHLNPIVDIQLGKDQSDGDFTYNNTRAIRIEGALYEKLSFSSTLYESQGRFASYFNSYANSIKPSGGNPAIIPGQGIAKQFGDTAYDIPVATGYLSYSPNQTFNFQLGRDKNFIGDGYRSLFLSDNGSSHTFIKIETKFWKIQYTNMWLWLRDVRPEVTVDGIYKRKFVALHHLSWNATKRLNIGLFESVVWSKNANQGFDFDYVNPVILFRPIEFAIGSRSGNALIGMNAKYQFSNSLSMYSQILIDEITMKELFGSDGYWGNKYAFQMGLKYTNAFRIPNLTLQGEYNMVRPYTYSHSNPVTNYGHYNQSLSHLWGSNFREGVFITKYHKNRWFGMLKLVGGIKGFDYDTTSDMLSYGGNIYKDYSERIQDYGIKTGQGNKATILIGDLQAGYLINPATNLKVFGSLLVRKFDAPIENPVFKNETNTWISFGIRSDLSNWYFDF